MQELAEQQHTIQMLSEEASSNKASLKIKEEELLTMKRFLTHKMGHSESKVKVRQTSSGFAIMSAVILVGVYWESSL